MPFDFGRTWCAARDLLCALGFEDWAEIAELRETPSRIAGFYQEFMEWDSGKLDTTFEPIKADEMVIVKGVECWSLCSHHLFRLISI